MICGTMTDVDQVREMLRAKIMGAELDLNQMIATWAVLELDERLRRIESAIDDIATNTADHRI